MMDDISSLPSMQLKRGSFGITTLDRKIYAIGGHVGKTHDWKRANYTAECEAFDLDSLSWSPMAPRPLAAEGFRAVGHGPYVYAFGGMTFDFAAATNSDSYQSTAQIDRYDTRTNTWTTIGKLPNPRSDYMLVQLGSTLYFIGGWSLDGEAGTSSPPLTAVDSFDLDAEITGHSGYTFPSKLNPRVGGVALSRNGAGFILGGVHHPNMFKQTTVFEPGAQTVWRDLPSSADMPIGLIDQCQFYVPSLDRVWIFGGYSSGENNSKSVFSAYVPALIAGEKSPWRKEPDMPRALMFFGLEEIRPGLLGIIGGCCDPATSGPQTAECTLYPLNMTNDKNQETSKTESMPFVG